MWTLFFFIFRIIKFSYILKTSANYLTKEAGRWQKWRFTACESIIVEQNNAPSKFSMIENLARQVLIVWTIIYLEIARGEC